MGVRELVCPAIYKHFKDKYYATMGVAKRLDELPIDWYDTKKYNLFTAEYTEATDSGDKDVSILIKDGHLYHIRKDLGDLVVYKSLYDGHIAYVRDVDMFLSEVDKEKYPNESQKYRFELLRY